MCHNQTVPIREGDTMSKVHMRYDGVVVTLSANASRVYRDMARIYRTPYVVIGRDYVYGMRFTIDTLQAAGIISYDDMMHLDKALSDFDASYRKGAIC